MKRIIGILGEKLAGKDTVANYLVEKYGATHVRTSHILDELLNTLGLPVTRRNEIDAGKGMETMFGSKVIGDAALKRVQQVNAELVVLNGMRQPYEFEGAKALGAKIIYVTAPVELRYQRSLERKNEAKDNNESLEQFAEQDHEWIEKEIPRLGTLADFKVENTGSVAELHEKLDSIIQKISN